MFASAFYVLDINSSSYQSYDGVGRFWPLKYCMCLCVYYMQSWEEWYVASLLIQSYPSTFAPSPQKSHIFIFKEKPNKNAIAIIILVIL